MISEQTNHQLGDGISIVPTPPAVAEHLVGSASVRCISSIQLIAIEKDSAQEPIIEMRLSMGLGKKASMPASSASEMQKI